MSSPSLPLDPDWVADQARCILDDIPVAPPSRWAQAGFTIGESWRSSPRSSPDYPDVPSVLDPVLRSLGRGDEFASDITLVIRDPRSCSCPQSTVVTPNIPEAAAACGRRTTTATRRASPNARSVLLDSGCEYVLVTARNDTPTAGAIEHALPPRRRAAFRGQRGSARPELYGPAARPRTALRRQPRARGAASTPSPRRGLRGPGLHLAGPAANAYPPGHGAAACPDRLFWARESDASMSELSADPALARRLKRASTPPAEAPGRPGELPRAQACEPALDGGAAAVQYRAKRADAGLALRAGGAGLRDLQSCARRAVRSS